MRPTPGQPGQEVDRLVARRRRRASRGRASVAAARAGPPGSAGAFVGARPPGLIASSPPRPARRGPPPRSGSARAAARRRRRGCGRWCSGRGSSARARRSGGRAGRSPAARRARAAGRGSRARAAAAGAASRSLGAASVAASLAGRAPAKDIVLAPRCASVRASAVRPRRRRARPSTAAVAGDGPAGASSCTATRPTRRTGCRSSSALDGPALALDLPGWGRSERRPAAALRLLDGRPGAVRRARSSSTLEDRGYSLVVHDWGVVGLIAAQAPSASAAQAGRDQRRAAPARLPLALGRARLAASRRSASSPTRPPPRPAAGLLLRQAPRRPRADAGRVHRHGLGAGDARDLAAVARPLPLRRPRACSRPPASASAARLPGAGRLGRATTPTCRADFGRAYASAAAARGAARARRAPATGRGSTAPSWSAGRRLPRAADPDRGGSAVAAFTIGAPMRRR